MNVSAYLHFDGQCEEAFGFYANTFRGEIITLMRWEQMPGEAPPAGMDRKIMHARLKIGLSDILGSDPPPERYARPVGFGVSLDVDSSEEAERIFMALSEGGTVTMPIGASFFAHRFAMVTDRYAIPWLIMHVKR